MSATVIYKRENIAADGSTVAVLRLDLRKAVAKMKQLRQTVGQSNFEAEGGGNVRDEEHIARKDGTSSSIFSEGVPDSHSAL